ncbi:MAG: Ig-like domain-containing protein, partial [Deltaproteobacteria bacterium]|nr:Ig-like domain-containing protein [Deltaproteobacteria bacterium]
MPTEVVTVRFGITGPDMKPMTEDFEASAGSGTVEGVPAGNERVLTLQGLNASNTVIFEGVSGALTVEPGKVADAGAIPMIAISPPGDASVPSAVSNFSALSGNGSIVLSWTNPSEIYFVGVRITRLNGSTAPTNPTEGDLVYDGTDTSITDTGLSIGMSYSYAAFSYNGVPYYSVPAIITALPSNNWTPTVSDDAGATSEDSPVDITLPGTDNDAGDVLSYAAETEPANGTVSISGGTATYTPDPDFNGQDSFTFTATDGKATSNTGTITVTINAVNDAPTAASAEITTGEDTASAGVVPSVTDVDLALEGDTYSFTIETQPADQASSGTASVVDNQLVFTPKPEWSGSTSFTFTATDAGEQSVTGTATVTVNSVNDAPTIGGTPVLSATEDSPYSFTVNGTDVDAGAELTYSLVGNPAWMSINAATGAVTGTPANGDVGTAEGIEVCVSDGIAAAVCLPAFDVTVANTNDAPVISGLPVLSAIEDAYYSDASISTLDVDVGDSLIYTITGPSWLEINSGTGQLSGTPLNADVGDNSFQVTVKDSSNATDTLGFIINVTNSNDAPTDASAEITTGEDTASAGVAPSVTDPDVGDTHTITIEAQPADTATSG